MIDLRGTITIVGIAVGICHTVAALAAPLNPPKLDDRTYTDLLKESQALLPQLNNPSGLTAKQANSGETPPTRTTAQADRAKPKTDLGSSLKNGVGARCCSAGLNRIRAGVAKIREDFKKLRAYYGSAKDQKGMHTVERMETPLKELDRSIQAFAAARDERSAKRHAATISQKAQQLHDDAMTVIRKLEADRRRR